MDGRPNPFERRKLLKLAALAAGSSFVPALAQSPSADASVSHIVPSFPTKDPRWLKTWNAAIAALDGNLRPLPRYTRPVLIEGAVYGGIWQECGPHEGLVYATLSRYIPASQSRTAPLQVARNNHMAFFALQRPDGQLPASIKLTDTVPSSGELTATGGYGQIQMVVPIAATAWELAQLTDDDELLVSAYTACSRWDAWLRQYRDTRKTGLVEAFCAYDTGHDNSPRWAGIANRCPDGDARRFAPQPGMPRLSPDLSATVYGARVALAQMATALGKHDESARWQADAEKIRQLIIAKLYSPEDAAFYDLDSNDKFVCVRSDVISRVLGEHVLNHFDAKDKAIFEAVWTRQIHNPKAFWAPYPLSSIALDDPAFVRPIPRNSWGGASQALTALRAPRWMRHYGKQAELNHLMQQWCEAIMRHTEFRQQMDPLTGIFTQPDPGGYSPAALAFLDFARHLSHAAA
jgi:Bacterial alpha-L-rhamnosidase 6 hairpin glycosidase domain